jgi:adenylosuccinate lyase
MLLHYSLVSMRGIIDKMEVNRDAMRRNLDAGFGLHAASRLLIALVNAGLAREAAYTLVQRAASTAREKRISLYQVAGATPEITSALSPEVLTAALDERAAIANCGILVDRLKEIERAS